jgi:hypothetical protein
VRGAKLPPRRKTGSRPARRGKGSIGDNPALALALKSGPYAVAAAVLIGMLIAATTSKKFRDIATLVTVAIGGLSWVTAYYWGISIAARDDSFANVGYFPPRTGMRFIVANREHMKGPFRLLMIGLAFIAMTAVFSWIGHKQAGY